MIDLSKIAKDIVSSVKSYVDGKLDDFSKELHELKETVETFPIAEKGDKGDPADPEVIKELVQEAVKSLPDPKPGKDAEPVNIDEIQKLIDTAVAKAISEIEIPVPENGKDALEINILPEIESGKSYSRGTYAIHKGGLWRSFEKTNCMRGWETVVDGINDIKIDYDGERSITVTTEKSSGAAINKEFTIPAMIYRDVYVAGKTYQQGDTCTYAGSLYTCSEETSEKPGTGSKAWRLSTKRGRDGKDKS